jgi:hypothetical protein
LKISGFNLPNPGISPLPGRGLHLSIQNVGIGLTFEFRFSRYILFFPVVSNFSIFTFLVKGTGVVGVGRTSLAVNMAITNNNGRSHLTVQEIGFNLGDFSTLLL